MVPTSEESRIENMDVAVAICGGKARNRIIVGTITEPPPMPNKLEMNPTKSATPEPNHKLNA